jgi:hypothetical protein
LAGFAANDQRFRAVNYSSRTAMPLGDVCQRFGLGLVRDICRATNGFAAALADLICEARAFGVAARAAHQLCALRRE